MVARKKRVLGRKFQPGNVPWNSEKCCLPSSSSSASDLFCHSISNSDLSGSNNQSETLHRPEKRIYEEAISTEAKWAQCSPESITILPSKLRPANLKENYEDLGDLKNTHVMKM